MWCDRRSTTFQEKEEAQDACVSGDRRNRPAQIPTPPASVSCGANTLFVSGVNLPALSEIAIEQGPANPLEGPPASSTDTADTQMLDDLVGAPSIVPNTKRMEMPTNHLDYVDAPTELDVELPVPPTMHDDEISQPQAPQAAVQAAAPQDSIGIKQPEAAVPVAAPQGSIGVKQPEAAVPAPIGVINPL